MSVPLDLALSPYHLATREPPAMLALILGSRVVTLLPQPAAGTSREAVREAVDRAPRYLRLMESWRWSSPLWQSGVIASGLGGEEAAGELEGVYETIRTEDALAGLRPLCAGAGRRAAEGAHASLDFIAADLLRGGPDPGVNIPVSAALDRFARRHHLCVVRSGATSIAQRAEARMARRVFGVAVPILLRAGGGRIGRLRADLSEQLEALREAIGEVGSLVEEGAGPAEAGPAVDRLASAAAAYSAAFRAWAPLGATGDDENHERVTSGYVSLTGVLLPADAVLRSSCTALAAIQGVPSGSDAGPADEGRLFALVVREMSVQPE
jgi:hypothetical protein